MDIIYNNINDILDSKGEKKNFLNNEKYSEDYINLAKKWSNLPLYKNKDSIKNFFDLLNNKQVILLISGTGSGKTVLVPKFFLKYVITLGLPTQKIIITNPKILTTEYNAEYSAKTLDVNIGSYVGYKYKGSKKSKYSDKTKLLYATDGLILSMIYSDNLLSEYTGIIIDEAHERHINIDILLKLLKDIILVRKDFKVIIMSATINSEIFRQYFNIKNILYGEIEITGESHYNIEEHYLEKNIKINKYNYLDIALKKCLDILKNTKNGDIIIFVPVQNDALNGCKELNILCDKNNINDLFCIEVFSKMKKSNKDLATSKDLYKENSKFNRKVIFATNLAESSITFDGLVYVIDTGYELLNYYEATDNSYVVEKKYTTQAQIKQRIGRSGRTQPGIAYHLYSKELFDSLQKYPEPNIIVTDLTENIISILNYVKNIKHLIIQLMEFITIPKIQQIVMVLYKLSFYKCIKLVNPIIKNNLSDSESDNTNQLINFVNVPWLKFKSYDNILENINGTLTTIGLNILKFRSSSLISALTIILSKYMNCQKEIIKLMAIIEITDGKFENLFIYNKKDIKNVQKYFNKYNKNNSDHLTILHIYNHLFKQKIDKYLNIVEFKKINERIHNLNSYASSIDDSQYNYMKDRYNIIIKKNPYDNIEDNILFVLCLSHLINLIKKEKDDLYTSINLPLNSTALIEYFIFTKKLKQNDKYAICNNLINRFGKKLFQCISVIPNYIMNDIKLENLSKNII